MKNQDDIDKLLIQTLSEEDAEVLKKINDQGLFDMMAANFKGKLKWIAMLTAAIMLVLFALSVYCFIRFYNAPDLREMMLWGAGMGFAIMAVSQLKTWHWMQMDKNSLLREIKRLELRISLLAKK